MLIWRPAAGSKGPLELEEQILHTLGLWMMIADSYFSSSLLDHGGSGGSSLSQQMRFLHCWNLSSFQSEELWEDSFLGWFLNWNIHASWAQSLPWPSHGPAMPGRQLTLGIPSCLCTLFRCSLEVVVYIEMFIFACFEIGKCLKNVVCRCFGLIFISPCSLIPIVCHAYVLYVCVLCTKHSHGYFALSLSGFADLIYLQEVVYYY